MVGAGILNWVVMVDTIKKVRFEQGLEKEVRGSAEQALEGRSFQVE